MTSAVRVLLLFLLVAQVSGEEPTCNSDEAALVQKEVRLGQVRGNAEGPKDEKKPEATVDEEKDEEKEEKKTKVVKSKLQLEAEEFIKNAPEEGLKRAYVDKLKDMPRLGELWGEKVTEEEVMAMQREADDLMVQAYGLAHGKAEKKQRKKLKHQAEGLYQAVRAWQYRESVNMSKKAMESTDAEERLALLRQAEQMTTSTATPTIDYILNAQAKRTGAYGATHVEDTLTDEVKQVKMKNATKARVEKQRDNLHKMYHGQDSSNPLFWAVHHDAMSAMVGEEWAHTVEDISRDVKALSDNRHSAHEHEQLLDQKLLKRKKNAEAAEREAEGIPDMDIDELESENAAEEAELMDKWANGDRKEAAQED